MSSISSGIRHPAPKGSSMWRSGLWTQHLPKPVVCSLLLRCCAQSLLLVLEDDMEVLRWPTQGLLASAPRDWEVLMLYSLGGLANDLYQADNVSLWFPWAVQEKLFNTGAYLINRAGMKKVCSP